MKYIHTNPEAAKTMIIKHDMSTQAYVGMSLELDISTQVRVS